MADLKVVTPEMNGSAEGPTLEFNENNEKALEFEQKMQDLQAELMKKKYRVKTTSETLDYLMTDFFNNVAWNGYECYAISETNKEMTKIVDRFATKEFKNNKRSFTLKVEVLEALFHFIKQHTGTGLGSASNHRALCEDFSVAMAELNVDRAALRDLAMEAEAAKHGITVEDYKKAADAMHAQQNASQPNLR